MVEHIVHSEVTEEGGDPACWAHLQGDPIQVPTIEFLAGVLSDLTDAIIVSDADGRITFWNHAATGMFGWADDEVLGVSLDLIVPNEHRRRHWDAYFRAMSTGLGSDGDRLRELPAVHRDGHLISIALRLTPIRAKGSSRLAGVVAVVRDETERHRGGRPAGPG